MKPKSSVQKNNLVVFPYEYTHVYPYIYMWYICIAMMIYKNVYWPTGISLSADSTKIYCANLTRHHFDTHARTHAIMKVYMGSRPCRIESRQI